MTDDQRALLDECANRPTCTAAMHLSDCPSSPNLRLLGALQRSVDAARAARRPGEPATEREVRGSEWQTWARASTLPTGAAMTEEVSIEVNEHGQVQISESLLAQLLVDAGWERTA